MENTSNAEFGYTCMWTIWSHRRPYNYNNWKESNKRFKIKDHNAIVIAMGLYETSCKKLTKIRNSEEKSKIKVLNQMEKSKDQTFQPNGYQLS